MKSKFKQHFKRAVCGVVAASMLGQPLAASAAMLAFAQSPLFVNSPIPPMVMLDISKDQQLYKKAYNDYSDLDGDGVVETTYKHGIDYYGYFDSYKCYTYSTANKRFEPAVYNTKTATEASDSTNNLAAKYCSTSGSQSTRWSGNFLNWATMTRVDAVRKLLYGGMRSPTRTDGDGNGVNDGDTATSTVLERTLLPNDAHSFAKYYAGTDVTRLTPFTRNSQSWTSSTSIAIGTGDKQFTLNNVTGIANGDIVLATASAGYMSGVVKNLDTNNKRITLDSVTTDNLSGTGTPSSWTITNLSTAGVTICNTTKGGSGGVQDRSQTNTNLPRMRVVQGNYALWAANERWQCGWNDEHGASPSNRYGDSSVPANNNTPTRTGTGNPALDNKSDTDGRGDYFVRIQACASNALIGTEKCKEYNTSNSYKPIGLLQIYGENGQIQFGLMTGSYNKNISGGVLRKNVGTLADEVAGNGTFVTPSGGSIINTLNRLRIWGYRYDDGTYIRSGSDSTADNCGFQLTSISEGSCNSWGNPMSEVYYESLRYFAGATSATTAFVADDSSKISGLVTATWPSTTTTVLSNSNYCAPINILVFNASVSTNETDGQIGNPFTGLTFNAVTATTNVGINEGITGTAKYFVGRTSATGSSTTTDNEYCDAKTQTGLGNMYGICPEGPTLAGSYLMGGLAHQGHVNKIRNDLTVPAGDNRSLKVNTYGISLATNTPAISIILQGQTTPKAVIQPAYRLNNTAPQGGGSLVDMQIVQQTTTAYGSKGKIYLNWEDSEQGGDYDQDMWGVLSYCLQTTDTSLCGSAQGQNTIIVTTKAISESTAGSQGFGYIISGTSKDGPHFHTGIRGFIYSDPTNIPVTLIDGTAAGKVNTTGGCQDCQVGETATTAKYSLSSTAPGSPLKDPLWYAAKYGGFKDSDGDNLPNQTSEWDVFLSDGTAGSDAVPDNYFLVSNPLGLEKSLNTLFVSILATASASAAAANSSRLITNTKVYQAVFNTQDWSSKLLSYGVNISNGVPNTTPDWDAGQQAIYAAGSASANQNSRTVLTYNKGVASAAPRGIPFRWPSNPSSPTTSELSAAQINFLKTNPSTAVVESDTLGQNRLLYVRGDATNEGTSLNDFRPRPITKLGDIVNSNINFVGPPSSGYADPTYASFATNSTNSTRTPMLYVGANDGMLHAFNASTGVELFSYVPAKMYRKLPQLTSKTYSHTYFVDGSPAVEDAKLGSGSTAAWKTVLVGGYNAGGQGIYAIDVTTPNATTFAESNASNVVMWEFTDADDADLGYTYGDPLIRQMSNGKWAAIVSSGYNNSDSSTPGETACTAGSGTVASPYTPAGCTSSTSGAGYLFIIYLDGPTGSNGTWTQGTDYIKIKTASVSAATAASPAGLSAPLAIDVTGDNKVDYVYAGDLLGNMWKFDVRSTTAANWTTSTNVVSLYTAKDASDNVQPITSRPQWALHPTGSGYIVSFGTGKYLESADVTPTSSFRTQTVYGIWDRNNGATVSAQTVVADRTSLMQQLMLYNTAGDASPRFRVLSKFLPNYTNATITYLPTQVTTTDADRPANSTSVPPQKGWYFDLSNATSYVQGERNIFSPDLRNGITFYSTLWPTNNACLGAADGDNLVFNIGTGGRPDFSVFDSNGNGIANSSDFLPPSQTGLSGNVAASTMGISGGASQTPTFIRMPGQTTGSGGVGASGYGLPNNTGSQNTGIQSTTGGKLAQAIYSFGQDFGRISWREIVND